MQGEAILVVQVISLILVMGCIVASIYLFNRSRTRWVEFFIPLILLLNLGLFLIHRVITKAFSLNLPPSSEYINQWAIGIQFHTVITALVFIIFVFIRQKRLDHG